MIKPVFILLSLLAIPAVLSFSQTPAPQAVGDPLAAKFDAASNSSQRYEAVRSMKDANSPVYNELFLKIVEGSFDYNVKRMALLGLEMNAGGQNLLLADRISRVLSSEKDPLLVEAELNLMAVIGSEKHTGLVMPFLLSQDIYVREAGIKALSVFGDRSCVDGARRLLESESGDDYHAKTVRKYSMLVLQKYSDPEALAALESSLVKSLNNRTNQDESLYAVTAIRSIDTNTARQVLQKNAGLITNVDVRSNLYGAVDLPVPEPVVVPVQPAEPLPPPPPPPPPVPETKPEGYIPVAPSAASTRYDFDPSTVAARYTDPGEALRQVIVLSNLAVEIEDRIASGELAPRYQARLGDVYYKMAEILSGLKDRIRSARYYRDASTAYQKAGGP